MLWAKNNVSVKEIITHVERSDNFGKKDYSLPDKYAKSAHRMIKQFLITRPRDLGVLYHFLDEIEQLINS